MVQLLLRAGASHFADGVRLALSLAIRQRRENIALMLSEDMQSGDVSMRESEGTALQMACEMKLARLVRFYLERGAQHGLVVDIVERSNALCRVLRLDDRFCSVPMKTVERRCTSDCALCSCIMARIQMCLLNFGPAKTSVRPRSIAAMYSDARMRALIDSRKPLVPECNASTLQSAWRWMTWAGNETCPFLGHVVLAYWVGIYHVVFSMNSKKVS